MYNQITNRNIGIFSFEEQEKLRNTSCAIAGVGGIGGLLAERLIRIGVGNLKISDPATFDLSNLNRQFGSNISTLNKYKAQVVAAELQNINPEARITFDTKGIHTQQDADDFVKGATIVFDEMDYGLFVQNIYLQRAARNNGIYYIFSSALGFGALVVTFIPNGLTLEEYNGLSQSDDINSINNIKLTIKNLFPTLPSYLKGKEELIQQIINKEAPVSSNSIGVGLASIITANEGVKLMLNYKDIIIAPKVVYYDLMDRSLT